MISISEAWKKICEHTTALGTENILLPHVSGRRLACDLAADVDSPPHDKSLMDGYAVRSVDVAELPKALQVLEIVTAGSLPTRVVGPGMATRIMTGAPVPTGADAIVMSELTDGAPSTGNVTINQGAFPPGSHILRMGQCIRKGEIVFRQGHCLRALDIGLLAEIGFREVPVYRRPRIAILSTGNELVPCSEVPGPGQIRNSNGPMLATLAAKYADSVIDLGIAADQTEDLIDRMESSRECEILIVSGGVSEGLVDLVPKALTNVGFEEVFHKVSIKPGKPIWFGTHREGNRIAVGLPGNPVSSLCCFEVFVRLAIDRMCGTGFTERRMQVGFLASEHSVRGPRPTYWPCQIEIDGTGRAVVAPLVWQGSSDLKCLREANGFAFFPPRETPYPAQTLVSFLPIGGSSTPMSHGF